MLNNFTLFKNILRQALNYRTIELKSVFLRSRKKSDLYLYWDEKTFYLAVAKLKGYRCINNKHVERSLSTVGNITFCSF